MQEFLKCLSLNYQDWSFSCLAEVVITWWFACWLERLSPFEVDCHSLFIQSLAFLLEPLGRLGLNGNVCDTGSL